VIAVATVCFDAASWAKRTAGPFPLRSARRSLSPARSTRSPIGSNPVASVDGGLHHGAVHESRLINQGVGPMWLPGR
jgi:hypothetical protein